MSVRHSEAAKADLRHAAHPPVDAAIPDLGAGDHHLGDLNAPLHLIEYGDYQCPFCALAHPGVTDLIRRHGSDLVFAFRHFPLVSQHPHAWLAACAAEAAARQGRFWEMHNHLLSHQHELTHDDLATHARALGLDMDQFERDLMDNQVAELVREDALGGVHGGVRGTPTFFVNGRRLEGGYREDEIEAALSAGRST
ncbi:MAG TPA: thioredoxin domain-containing protein [Candidatus Dormibacteraeota bacterium]